MLERSVKWAKIQRKEADAMTLAWAKFVSGWREMWEAFKLDSSNPNPFEEPNPDDALVKLKKQLAKEDESQRKAGKTFPHEMSPSVFLQRALEVEMTQRKLKARHLDEDSTATFPERRRALSRSINNLRIPQRLYMPGVAADLDAIDTTTLADRPEDVKLYIPSSLPPSARDAQCISELPHLEYRIRCAQAAHFLDAIRLFRRLIRAVTKKTRVHIYGTQRTTTRTHGLYDKATTKQARAVSGYRASRNAISALAPNEEFGSWKTIFLELKDSDIRGPGCEAEEPSASRFIQSWIWTTSPHITTSTEDSDLQATVRIEWCKAQARAKRFEEEVELVVEEMRRTLAYFEWKACEWERHATTPPLGCQAIDKTTAAGITSYAYKQANVQREMVKVFIDDWHELLKENALGSYWLDEWTTPSGNKRRCLPSNVRLFHSEPSTPRTGTPCAPELLPDDASSSITTSDDSRNE